MTPAPSKAIAKRDYNRPATSSAGLLELGKPLLPQIAAALPAFLRKHEERFLRTLITECSKTPRLMDCTPISLFGGLIQVAQLGLELGGPMGQAYLIPFKTSAQLVIGYRGYITLAERSGQIKRITPVVVREGDLIRIIRGEQQRLVHEPAMSFDGAPIGYYAVVERLNSGTDFEYLTVKQAEEHRAKYALQKSDKGPWFTNFDEMSMKTCIRKLAKRVPLSVQWQQAAGVDELAELDVSQGNESLVVLEGEASTDRADELKDRLDKAKKGKPVASTPGSVLNDEPGDFKEGDYTPQEGAPA